MRRFASSPWRTARHLRTAQVFVDHVAFPENAIPVKTLGLVFGGQSVHGSLTGTAIDHQDAVDCRALHGVRPMIDALSRGPRDELGLIGCISAAGAGFLLPSQILASRLNTRIFGTPSPSIIRFTIVYSFKVFRLSKTAVSSEIVT